ncbi:MAG TPA: hypothetical protein VJ464_25345 [Blastocatellia bacterium]|nr:hypothetical protein [Blastocatellia bacterium]
MAIRELDDILLPLVEAGDADEADTRLAAVLAEHAEPVIRGVVKNKLRVSLSPADGSAANQDALEIASDVQAALVTELRRLRSAESREPISDFRGYVAVLAFHACYRYLRRRNPERHSLKSKVRYILSHAPEFALWQDADGAWLCDTTARRRSATGAARARPDDEALSARLLSRLTDPAGTDLTDLLAAILGEAAGAMELDEIVSFVAALQGIRPIAEQGEGDVEGEDRQRQGLADPRADVAAEVDHRLYLEHLWREIGELPPRQRLALLLNLRDAQGRDVIALLPITGVASLRQIADVLGIPAEEFAALWNDLPMDDARIAGRLGITRQQVINLRKSARERLMRRMKYH